MTQSILDRGDGLECYYFIDGIRGFKVLVQSMRFLLIATDSSNRVSDSAFSDRGHPSINIHARSKSFSTGPELLPEYLHYVINLALAEDLPFYVLESFWLVIKLENLKRRARDILVFMVHELYDSRDKHTELFLRHGAWYQCQSVFGRLACDPG